MIRIIMFLCLSLSGDIACSSENCDSALDKEVVLEKLTSNFKSFSDGFYVEYDLFVVQRDGTKSHKLFVTESLDQKHHFLKVVHWYHRDVYDFYGYPELDPILNWYYWTPEEKKQLWLTTGTGAIYKADPVFKNAPAVQYYSGYMGMLPPDRTCVPSELSEEEPVDCCAKDYYLPFALRRGTWDIKMLDSGLVALEKKTETFCDLIVIDPKMNFAITERNIQVDSGEPTMRIQYGGFKKVRDNFFLPTRIVISTENPYDVEYKVKKIQIENIRNLIPKSEFPPGTIVHDTVNHKSFIVPGGIELLDLTVRRMQLALDKQSQKSAWNYEWTAIVILLLISLFILLFRFKLYPMFFHDNTVGS